MSADQSGELRDVLASQRTLLAYIRTALSFAGLGFAVAKFGLSPRLAHVGAYIGTFMVLVGLVLTVVGLAQHRALLRKLEPQAPGTHGHTRALHMTAGIASAVVCALLAVYIITAAA
jgi:putative membrane protein